MNAKVVNSRSKAVAIAENVLAGRTSAMPSCVNMSPSLGMVKSSKQMKIGISSLQRGLPIGRGPGEVVRAGSDVLQPDIE